MKRGVRHFPNAEAVAEIVVELESESEMNGQTIAAAFVVAMPLGTVAEQVGIAEAAQIGAAGAGVDIVP